MTRRALLGAAAATAGAPAVAASGDDVFRVSLTDWIGRDWRAERVRIEVDQRLGDLARLGAVDAAGRPAPIEPVGDGAVELLVDLPKYSRLDLELRPGAATRRTDIRVETGSDQIVLRNDQGGVAVRRRLTGDAAPIAGVDRGDGVWTGASRFIDTSDAVAAYEATLERRGPVAASVRCRTRFASGATWDLVVTLQASDPAVLVDETWSAWDHPAWTLDFGANFSPQQLYYRAGSGDPLGKVALAPIGGAAGAPVFTLEPWLRWWMAERQGLWVAAKGPAPKALVLAALRGDLWVDEADAAAGRRLTPLTARRTSQGFDLLLPGSGAHRRWLVAMLPPEALDPALVGKFAKPPPQELVIRHGDFPLDRVKDQVLEWRQGGRPYERLILQAGDLARLHGSEPAPGAAARATAFQPGPDEIGDARLGALVDDYLRTGDPDLGRRLSQAALPQMQAAVDLFVRQDGIVSLGFAPHWHRPILYAAHLADFAFADGLLAPSDQARLRAQAAFLADTVSRPDYWSPPRGFSANPGMTTMARTYQAYTAALVVDHPRGPAWLDGALDELTRELETWSDENGGWLEAPHYALNAVDCLLGAALCARSRGRPQLFDSPRLKQVIEWFAKITTPPDVRLNGARHLPPLGNTYLLEATSEFGLCAYLWRDAAPALSARLQWMHAASGAPTPPFVGGAYPALAPYRTALIDGRLPARQPAYGSEVFPKTGAVLRAHLGTGRETMMTIIAGPNHEHYDYDSGSVTIWGKGQRIADDFGYTGRGPMSDHSMVDSAADREPMQIEAFHAAPDADYFAGRSGGWRRQALFVKSSDPLGPNYYVIRDALDAGADGTWRLFLGGEVSLTQAGAVALGEGDVATDVVLLSDQPSPPCLEQVSRSSPAGPTGSSLRTTQTALTARLPANAHLTAVIYPRLKSDQPPQVSLSADGSALRVASAHRVDVITLAVDGLALRPG